MFTVRVRVAAGGRKCRLWACRMRDENAQTVAGRPVPSLSFSQRLAAAAAAPWERVVRLFRAGYYAFFRFLRQLRLQHAYRQIYAVPRARPRPAPRGGSRMARSTHATPQTHTHTIASPRSNMSILIFAASLLTNFSHKQDRQSQSSHVRAPSARRGASPDGFSTTTHASSAATGE